MPRGKNYVNQNKGMTLTAHQRKSDGAKKEACLYGPACTRKDCIYDHSSTKPEFQKSSDPCMAYLAGQCLFTAPTCRKRHPPPHECDLLRVKYAKTKCRFGTECQTDGCLYSHDEHPYYNSSLKTAAHSRPHNLPPPLNEAAFPPLPGSKLDASSDSEQQQQQQLVHSPPLQQQQQQAAVTTMTPQQRHFMTMMMMQQRQQQPQRGWIPTPPGNPAQLQQQQQHSSLQQGPFPPPFPPHYAPQQQQHQPITSMRTNFHSNNNNNRANGNNSNNNTNASDSLNVNATEFVPGGGRQ